MNTAITHWGYTPSGESIYLFRLTNASGASIELTNLGASWVSAHMPDKHGIFENILLGYDNAEGYIKDTYYMGATVGRFANRIHQASFSIKDTTYQLEKNDGENTNHGGASGFHKKIWQWEQIDFPGEDISFEAKITVDNRMGISKAELEHTLSSIACGYYNNFQIEYKCILVHLKRLILNRPSKKGQ